ncbi:MAG: pyruvate kinase [Planctomycetes bacterium]|nr:pyruvate kinase [Planctomycetota bacterium]
MENARTLIVATLGPASSGKDTLDSLVDEGVDVFRINLSHGERSGHRELIRRAAAAGARVMIDLPGPKIRVRDSTSPFPVRVAEGDVLSVASDPSGLAGGVTGILLPPGIAFDRATVGSRVLIDDGNIELVIRSVSSSGLTVESVSDGEIKPRKGVAFSEDLTCFPPLVEADRTALHELAGEPFDTVAASFVKAPDTVSALRSELDSLGSSASIIAKIEDPAGVQNVEDILRIADGIMVARGDLGVCTPIAALPLLQKKLVALANYHRRTVIVATQMLESMTEHTRPTRAEVTDVANAVLDGADAVMLSAETAVGKYPVLTVRTMATIIAHAEKALRTGLKTIL